MSIDIDVELLSLLGLSPALAGRALQSADTLPLPTTLSRIIEVHRETHVLHDGRASHAARPLPRLLRMLQGEDAALAVGDWVLASRDGCGAAWIEARVAPSTQIVRRDGDGRRHVVVSNVDTALLVMGLDADFNPRRLERYFALVHGEGIGAVVVLTKRDVAAPTDAVLDARLADLRGRIPPSAEVLAIDATNAAAADALAPCLGRGQTLVMLGSSGAGKSTLTNTLLGHCVQDTGPTRENDGRGKHTTTARSLHRLPGGACVIDTPGVRTLRPDGEGALAGVFADIAELAGHCRFRDCRHESEPGCAVRAGVDADRLRNWHKLLRETRRDTATALDRQREVAMWKARGRAAAARMRAKREA